MTATLDRSVQGHALICIPTHTPESLNIELSLCVCVCVSVEFNNELISVTHDRLACSLRMFWNNCNALYI